jgi:N-acyl-D-aspartate/D-glutamate deacylase
MPVDIIIRNARVLDGSGAASFEGDLELDDGRIRSVGSALASARQEIDAKGLCLSPGFIDVHSHDDGAFIRYPDMHFKLSQGVTTCVCGNCGFSAIPAKPGEDPGPASGGIISGAAGEFSDLEGYFDAVLAKRPAINAIMLVGHNTVRAQVMGMDERAPTAAELGDMRSLVAQAMEQGACGFSTGLIYRPGRWSDTEEVVGLAREVSAYGGLYTTHMRNEGDRLLEAGLINRHQLELALREQKRTGRLIGAVLHELGFVSEPDIAAFLAQDAQTPTVDVSTLVIDPGVVGLLPFEFCREEAVLPIKRDATTPTIRQKIRMTTSWRKK